MVSLTADSIGVCGGFDQTTQKSSQRAARGQCPTLPSLHLATPALCEEGHLQGMRRTKCAIQTILAQNRCQASHALLEVLFGDIRRRVLSQASDPFKIAKPRLLTIQLRDKDRSTNAWLIIAFLYAKANEVSHTARWWRAESTYTMGIYMSKCTQLLYLSKAA